MLARHAQQEIRFLGHAGREPPSRGAPEMSTPSSCGGPHRFRHRARTPPAARSRRGDDRCRVAESALQGVPQEPLRDRRAADVARTNHQDGRHWVSGHPEDGESSSGTSPPRSCATCRASIAPARSDPRAAVRRSTTVDAAPLRATGRVLLAQVDRDPVAERPRRGRRSSCRGLARAVRARGRQGARAPQDARASG